MGDDVLVGGDDGLAHRQRGRDQRVRRLVATHELDDDVDVVVGDQVRRRVGQDRAGIPAAARAPDVAHGDAGRARGRAIGRLQLARDDRCSARTTSRPTVPAPSTPTRSRAPLMTGCGRVATSVRMVADRSERPPGERRRLHSRAMTTDLAPAPAPVGAPARPAAHLLRHPAVRERPSRQRPGRDPQLRPAPGRVRGDLLHRRLPRADQPPTTRTLLRARTREMAASLLALGLDPDRCTLFVQSHRPEHTELAWLLMTVTPVSWLERTPTYKEKKREPARRRQPRPAHLPGPAGRRHRHLQGVARAGRQGPGRPPRAVARDRPRVQRAATARRSPSRRRSTPRRRSSSARTASGR